MWDQTLGYITWFAGSFEPQGWRFCNGQTLSIRDNEALYSLLGTAYGGDGQTTFRLPDMRDPANPELYVGFDERCPLKYIICVEGQWPTTN